MYMFKLPVIPKEKEKSHHPWERTIKAVFSNKINHLHNSIYNPSYPKKDVNKYETRVKFTVIGNICTKEFIYCSNLVKGLHKYRWKYFDCPVIKGVTGAGWPKVWNDLKLKYGSMAHCLTSQVAVLYNDEFFGGDKELIKLIESRYDYHLSLNYEKEREALFVGYMKSLARPCVYMHISIDDQYIGTMIFVVYADMLPRTSENFLRLCKERKGGYSGTPIHRIVKDGWIQCGGYGLKDTELDCESFVVPFNSRGILGMANADRHVDCSTQFFVLLQPAPWMQNKYVAFGHLVDGESTLEKIENVPTWYEASKSTIIIMQSGILNLECQDIMINRGARAYIEGHIDDLVVIGELFTELIMQKVYLEIEFKRIQRLQVEPEGEDAYEKKKILTEKLKLQKEEIGRQLEIAVMESVHVTPVVSNAVSTNQQFNEDENEVASYEEYTQGYDAASTSTHPVKTRPYYHPLTDVPYPGERDSTYDLQRFLCGDYCHECDLADQPMKPELTKQQQRKLSYISDVCDVYDYHGGIDSDEDDDDDKMLDSDEEADVRSYLKEHTDRVSFAGGVVRSIAKANKGMPNLFAQSRKSELITDDMLRKVRMASVDFRRRDSKKVSISAPAWDKTVHTEIKRRQTGFRTDDLEAIRIISRRSSNASDTSKSSDEDDRKVRIKADDGKSHEKHFKRRPTAFAFPDNIQGLVGAGADADEDEEVRKEEKKKDKDQVSDEEKEVHLAPNVDVAKHEQHNLHRRPTAFVFPQKFNIKDEDDDDEDKDGKPEEEEDKQVYIAPASDGKAHDANASQFKRRPTTFVRPGSIPIDDDDDEDDDENVDKQKVDEESDEEPKVHLAPTTDTQAHDADAAHFKRRPTTFVRPGSIPVQDDDEDDEDGDEDDDEPKVHLAPTTDTESHDAAAAQFKRRPTTFVRPGSIPIDDEDDDDDGDDEHDNEKTKVHMATTSDTAARGAEVVPFKRRPTTFVRAGSIPVDDDDDEDDDDDGDKKDYDAGDNDDDDDDEPHVQITTDPEEDAKALRRAFRRRPTAYVRPGEQFIDADDDDDKDDEDDKENKRTSVLQRLVEANTQLEYAPTLKNYKPLSEIQRDNIFLTQASNLNLKSDTKVKALLRTAAPPAVNPSIDKVLNIQHGEKPDRKMSSDYVTTIKQISHQAFENSIRSVEYSRQRPTISVSEYREKNRKYREELKKKASKHTIAP